METAVEVVSKLKDKHLNITIPAKILGGMALYMRLLVFVMSNLN